MVYICVIGFVILKCSLLISTIINLCFVFLGVKKTVLGLHAQGVPTDAIASRIKFETKGKDAKDIIEGIKYEDSMNDPSAKKNAFKREKALKDAIRQEEKNRRKTGKR